MRVSNGVFFIREVESNQNKSQNKDFKKVYFKLDFLHIFTKLKKKHNFSSKVCK